MLSYEELCEKIAEAYTKCLACGVEDPVIYMNEETFRILKEGHERYAHPVESGKVCGMAIRIRDDLPETTVFVIKSGEEPL